MKFKLEKVKKQFNPFYQVWFRGGHSGFIIEVNEDFEVRKFPSRCKNVPSKKEVLQMVEKNKLRILIRMK